MAKKGLFITFEGIEGSGKSSHCKLVETFLKDRGHDVLRVREPGGTVISEKIRDILLDKEHTQMTVECELLLYNAARVQIVHEVIQPALRDGKIVLCDRFFDSTIAYQCYGGKLDEKVTERMNIFAALGLSPDHTFLLDSDVERGLDRAGRGDRMELKSLDFHKSVREGFLAIAAANANRFVVVKEKPIADGAREIAAALEGLGL